MKYSDVTVGETYEARINGIPALVKVLRAEKREGRNVWACTRAAGGEEMLLTALALQPPTGSPTAAKARPTAAPAAKPQPDALGQLAAVLRDMSGRVERAALVLDLAAHGRKRLGADAQGMAAAELRPLEERARMLYAMLLADAERVTELLQAGAPPPKPEKPRPEPKPAAEPAPVVTAEPEAAVQPTAAPAPEAAVQPEPEAVQPSAAPTEPAAQPAAVAALKVRLVKPAKAR